MPPPALDGDFTEADARQVAIAALRAKAESSLGILYAVMGFSLLNVALIAFGSPITMAFGLAAVDFVAALAKEMGKWWVLVFLVFPFGFYAGLTALAKKHWGWFVLLMACYLIDGILSVIFQLWFGVAVHAYVLYLLFGGMMALRAARQLEKMPV